jgi:hypothetical protein
MCYLSPQSIQRGRVREGVRSWDVHAHGHQPFEGGTLTIMVGGDREAYERLASFKLPKA